MEGKVLGKRGFCVFVWQVTDYGKGVVMEQTAHARFDVTFSCLVLRPFTGEVMDCVVQSVSEQAVLARAGPLEVIIPTRRMPQGYAFSPELQGWTAPAGDVVLRTDSWIRCKIFSILYDLKNADWRCRAVGSLEETHLGAM